MSTPHLPTFPEALAELQGRSLEALSVLTDMSQRVAQGLVGLSTATATEALRACAELQAAAIEAARPGAAPLAALDPAAFAGTDPLAWCRRGLMAAVEGSERALRLAEANAQALTRSAERVQASTEQAGQEIRDAMTASIDRLKALYHRA